MIIRFWLKINWPDPQVYLSQCCCQNWCH